MKNRITVLILLLLALSVLLPPPAFADFSDDDVLNKLPVLTAEQMNQVPFEAHINSACMGVELYNPFRDKTIQGVVINISGKDPATGKELNMDVFVRLTAGPLNMGDDPAHGLFNAALFSKPESHTVITLKEIHYSLASPAPASKTKSAAKRASTN